MKICEYGNLSADFVLLQPVDGRDLSCIENEINEIKRLTGMDFCLKAVVTDDWNRDLSPWELPAVFGKEGFGGEAKITLEKMIKICDDSQKTYIIGGYSLAGLFSLWVACNTDVFSAVAAASPSVWFPGFTEYIKDNDIKSGAVYLSLGNREEKTKNPVMSRVGACIREIYETIKSNGTVCCLEWNEGNHFNNPDLRTAKAFARALNFNREQVIHGN